MYTNERKKEDYAMFDNASSSFRDEAKVFEFWIRSAELKEKQERKLKRRSNSLFRKLFKKS